MQISEFSQRTGLSRDTVRFYVRLGLFKPKTSAKGGSNPYQVFSDEDVQLAEVIRISQALGMSLKEIGALSQARREGRASVAEEHRGAVEAGGADGTQRACQFESMASYLRAKWRGCATARRRRSRASRRSWPTMPRRHRARREDAHRSANKESIDARWFLLVDPARGH
jgi:MerR family copper efflux transcriptional regulator